jgi:dolichol-phosphate mannosyltransferase
MGFLSQVSKMDRTHCPTIGIVVPCFSEGEEARRSIDRLVQVLDDSHVENFEVVVVVDGPVSETVNALSTISDSRIRVLVLPQNQGKGAAIKTGLNVMSSEFVAYIDGDLDVSPIAIVKGYQVLSDNTKLDVGCAYGSKFHPESKVKYPLLRRNMSRAFSFTVKLLFGFQSEDTQTGVKIFRYRAIMDHLPKCQENGFLLDLEIFAHMVDEGWKLHPIPVELDYQYSSSVRVGDVVAMALGLILLFRRLRLIGRTR